MRKLLKDKYGAMGEIGGVVALFIAIIIGILVLYSIAGGLDFSSVDDSYANQLPGGGAKDGAGNTNYNQTPADNASTEIFAQTETFFTIAPIIGIVVVAVIILSYVTRIGG